MGYWKTIIIEREIWVEDRLDGMQRRVREAAFARECKKQVIDTHKYDDLWNSGIGPRALRDQWW